MNKKSLSFKELVSLALRAFRNNPQRTILTILGMSVGIATVLLLISLGYGLQYILIGKLMTTEDSLVTMDVSYPAETNLLLKENNLKEISSFENVDSVSPVAELSGEMILVNGPSLFITNQVVDLSYFLLSGLIPTIGEYPTKNNTRGVVITSPALAPIGVENPEEVLGKKVNFNVFFQDDFSDDNLEVKNKNELEIIGIIEDENTIPMAILLSSELEKKPPLYTKALVKAKNTEVLESLRDQLQEQGFLVSAKIDLVNQARKFTNIITIILGVFGITALIVSAIGMFNTMLVGFLERIYEVGILKSIGATDHDVKNLFLVESIIMGFLGGIGGIVIGVGGGSIFNVLISAFSKKYGGEAIRLFLTPWWFIGLVVVFSIIIGASSGFLPARRASLLSPKEAFVKK